MLLNTPQGPGQRPHPRPTEEDAEENVSRGSQMTNPAFDAAAPSSEVVERGAGTGQAEASKPFPSSPRSSSS